MTNIPLSIIKRLLKLADYFNRKSLKRNYLLPHERQIALLEQAARTSPEHFIPTSIQYAKDIKILAGEWLILKKGVLALREQRQKLFYGWGYFYRLENIHRMLIAALGHDYILKSDMLIFGGDKMEIPYLPGTCCIAQTKQQIAEKKLRFVPCFSFVSWYQAKIDDYRKITHVISQKGLLPPEDKRILWLGNSDRFPIRHRLLAYGEKHHFCNFIDMEENHAFLDNRDKKPRSFISMSDQTNHKYLLDIQGGGYSGRIKFLLFSRRPVFMVWCPWQEFWFEHFKPWEHYIPVQPDLSDLEQNWRKLEASPDLYQQIAEGAYAFAQQHLTYEAALDYIRQNFD